MNQYATVAEYRALGGTMPSNLPDATVTRWLKLASLKLDTLVVRKIVPDDLSDGQLENLKMATVLQADKLYNVDQGIDPGVSSFSVTDMSVSFDSPKGQNKYYADNNIPLLVADLMNEAGLTWRGV